MRLSALLFKYRGELAIPVVLAAIAFGSPTSATLAGGILLGLCGETLRLGALRHIGPKSRRSRRASSHAVVRSGPYGWTRNPLYLGNLLMAGGVLVALNRWLLLVFGLPLALGYYRAIIAAEERALREQFGETYERYLGDVPRLLPRRPRHPDPSGPRFGWREVIPPELSTVVSFELLLVLAGAVAILRL